MKSKLLYLFIFLLSMMPLAAQEEVKARSEQDLFYTYMGPYAWMGYGHLSYSGWKGTGWRKENVSGITTGGGAALNIYAKPFAADFRLGYGISMPGYTITLMDISLAGRYLWQVRERMYVTPGLGIYCESGPSNRDFSGAAGLYIPVGVAYDLSDKIRLFGDFFFRFGSWGEENNGSTISYGLTGGILFRVGRM